jgi:transcriptional regulator with XRE-family HTH domain
MENTNTFIRPEIDLTRTGAKIKECRISKGMTIHDVQCIFNFEYPQAIYHWEKGKSIPTIDNLLVLSRLFEVGLDELIIHT